MAALPEGKLERMCKPADGDTNGGLTAGVTREGPVSFVPHVVPHPPVEQLGLLDLARWCRLESSVLGDFRRRHERRCPQPFSGSTGAHCRLARMVGAWRQTRTVRCMVRVIHSFSSCHRVAPALMSRRI